MISCYPAIRHPTPRYTYQIKRVKKTRSYIKHYSQLKCYCGYKSSEFFNTDKLFEIIINICFFFKKNFYQEEDGDLFQCFGNNHQTRALIINMHKSYVSCDFENKMGKRTTE